MEKRAAALIEVEARIAQPDFWNDQNKAKAAIAEANACRAVLKPYGELQKAIEDAQCLVELAEGEPAEDQRAHAVTEAESTLAAAEHTFENLELQSLLSGEFDYSNAYLTLHAGAGGTESCDWADMLLRMYLRFGEDHGFQAEVLDYQAGEEAGVRHVTFSLTGAYAYGYMKAERGVHRLVRISPFDSNKRRHTSFAALDVVAEVPDDVEVEIADADLRVDTYRASGAGGQHVNRTDSAVRLTHLPTGIIVACQAERSQHSNRARAMKMLRAKLYELMQDRKRKDMEKFYGAKGEIAWGSQIRSYVLQPYTMVKDHRTGCETSNVSAVLDGEIYPFVEAYLKKMAAGRK